MTVYEPVKCSVKADDVRRITFVEHLEFSDDLVTNSRFHFEVNELPCHNRVATLVTDFQYDAAVPCAELAKFLKIL